MTDRPARKKKRVRPARKIVPRGRMGIAWVIAPVAIAFIILVVGLTYLLTRS